MLHPSSFNVSEIECLFVDTILSPMFSCVGAKASINRQGYEFHVYDQLGDHDLTRDLYIKLKQFVAIRHQLDKQFASFIVCFLHPKTLDELQFERLFWKQLKALNDIDEKAWDPCVSHHVEQSNFSFSIAGEAFFVLGMHPNSQRHCRRFKYPAMVFNSHHQFNRLRDKGNFDKMQAQIRHREIKNHGSINPNLSDFGYGSEAKQYTGRAISKDWQCPVNFNNKQKAS